MAESDAKTTLPVNTAVMDVRARCISGFADLEEVTERAIVDVEGVGMGTECFS